MLNFYINGKNDFEFDMNGAKGAFMHKTAFGWIVSVERGGDVTYWWVAKTAREAFADCYRYLRNNRF